jgi:hypothetical protein
VAAPIIELAKSLIIDLADETGYTFERRVAPYLKREQVIGGKWIVIAAGDEQEMAGRHGD